MKADVPEHILAQIKPLKSEGRSIAEIAFLLRLDESVVRDRLNTTDSDSGIPDAPKKTLPPKP